MLVLMLDFFVGNLRRFLLSIILLLRYKLVFWLRNNLLLFLKISTLACLFLTFCRQLSFLFLFCNVRLELILTSWSVYGFAFFVVILVLKQCQYVLFSVAPITTSSQTAALIAFRLLIVV